MDQWYLSRDQQVYGPYTLAQMREWASNGRITPQDMVRRGDGEQWIPAGKVRGLFSKSSAKAQQVSTEKPVPKRRSSKK